MALTKVQVYSSNPTVEEMALRANPMLDNIQVEDITGLDPVKASINMFDLALVDGAEYLGSKLPPRNIVLYLRPNPDFSTWKYDTLRDFIYKYFMTKSLVRLVFHRGASISDSYIRRWIHDHDYSLDLAWDPDVNTDIVAVIRADGKIFMAEVDDGQLSGSDEPDWSSASSIGDSVSDNDLTWYYAGPSSAWPPDPTTWAPDTEYSPLSIVRPPVPNGHYYILYPGYGSTSGSDDFEWTTDSSSVYDGSLYWWDLGPYSGIKSLEIFGVVESCDANQFTKDPQYIVSILCEDPFFYATESTVVTGTAIRPDDPLGTVTNPGNVPVGIRTKVVYNSDDNPTYIHVQAGDPAASFFNVDVGVNDHTYFEMRSVPKKKFVRLVDTDLAITASALFRVVDGSTWPVLMPGENEFGVVTDAGNQDWTLTFYERYGGL